MSKWFENVFLPSQIDRAKKQDPKYGWCVILSEKQADICYRYMDPKDHHGEYGWFSMYHYSITGYRFTVYKQGRYTFMRITLDGIFKYIEIEERREQRKKNRIESLLNIDRNSKLYTKRLEKITKKYADAVELLKDVVNEYYSEGRDKYTLDEFHICLSDVVDAKNELDAITA